MLDESPLTWLDVARRLAALPSDGAPFPSGVVTARVGWFGLSLEVHAEVEPNEIIAALESLFPSRISHDPLQIELDAGLGNSHLPVEIEVVTNNAGRRQPFGVVDGVINFQRTPLRSSNRTMPIAAALSMKGGTGRTTTAISFALHWARASKKPILLVDADLEAPGISYLFESFIGRPKISLEDLIVLAHAEEAVGAPETTSFVAERLRDHHVDEGIFILPLRRNLSELAGSSVRPEHLSTTERPFALADLLADVAKHLSAAGVVVDVRAGLVPIGVNLAMDPDVAPIIVTSLGEQSIRATTGFVSFLAREFKRVGAAPRRPLLVVNRVPHIFRQTGIDRKLIEPLTTELASILPDDLPAVAGATDDIYAGLQGIASFIQVSVPELPDMQVSTGGWSDFVDQLANSGFAQAISEASNHFLMAELSLALSKTPVPEKSLSEVADARTLLGEFADQLIAAENIQGEVPRPLVTQSLSALASRYRSEAPIAIAEGAKGAGKTLAARYIVSKKTWNTVVRSLVNEDSTVRAMVVPIIASVQSSEKLMSETDSARQNASQELGFGSPLSMADATLLLKDMLSGTPTEGAWVNAWLDAIAWGVGFKPRLAGAGMELFDELRDRGRSIVAIFEGIEELYTSVNDPGIELAMRALLISLPQRLRSEPRRPVGMLAFARRDTVEAAVRQNLDQFRREYQPFALTWSEDDLLELAVWLAAQSEAIPDLWTPDFHKMSSIERGNALVRLWGTKLGPDDVPGRRTREAYTSAWVVAVLSDLRGRLVPRDLVRLLAGAAKIPLERDELETYRNRLLVPRALRAAVGPTSSAKVRETEEEIGELRPIFAKFKSQTDELSVPLTSDVIGKLGLGEQELATLIRHGIIFGDKPPYEVPELFRRGLGLKHAGARRSVVNLYNRARRLP